MSFLTFRTFHQSVPWSYLTAESSPGVEISVKMIWKYARLWMAKSREKLWITRDHCFHVILIRMEWNGKERDLTRSPPKTGDGSCKISVHDPHQPETARNKAGVGEVASVGNGQVLLRYLGEVSEDSLRQNFSTVCLGQVRIGIENRGGVWGEWSRGGVMPSGCCGGKKRWVVLSSAQLKLSL